MTWSSAALALLAFLAALTSAGCDSVSRIGEDLPRQDARLMLDSPPGAVHAGILLAAERGFDRGEGVRLRVRRPGAGGALRALRRERVDAALVPIAELAGMRAGGDDMVGVMALLQVPSTSVLASAAVASPAGLHGRQVAVGEEGTAMGVLRSIVAGDGGDIGALRTVRRPDAAAALESGRVAAATVDSIAEGVPLLAERPGLREWRPEDFGAPAYPGIVMVVTRRTLDERANVVRALIRTLQRGYREAQVDPASAATVLTEADPRARRDVVEAQLQQVAPRWTSGVGDYGRLRPDVLREWSRWAVDNEVVDRRLRVDEAFATELVTRQSTP